MTCHILIPFHQCPKSSGLFNRLIFRITRIKPWYPFMHQIRNSLCWGKIITETSLLDNIKKFFFVNFSAWINQNIPHVMIRCVTKKTHDFIIYYFLYCQLLHPLYYFIGNWCKQCLYSDFEKNI